MTSDGLPATAAHRTPASSSLRFLKAQPATVALCLVSCILVGFNFWYVGFGLRARKLPEVDPRVREVKNQVHQRTERYRDWQAKQKQKQGRTTESGKTKQQSRKSEHRKSSASTEGRTSSVSTKSRTRTSPHRSRRHADVDGYEPDYLWKVPDSSRKTSECDVCSAKACKAIRATTIHSKCCNTTGARKVWPLLVTATPRSGTVAVTNLLKELDVDVHTDMSSPGTHGHVSWIHLFNENHDIQRNRSKFVVPAYGRAFAHIGRRYWSGAHLVRNPLKSLTSIACTEPWFQMQWWYTVTAHVEIDRKWLLSLNHFGVAMAFYLAWHRAADAACMYRVRLEDLFDAAKSPPVMADLFNLAGLPAPTASAVEEAIKRVGRESNSRSHRPTVTWPELFAVDAQMASQILQLSREYGYAYEDVDDATLRRTPPADPPPNCRFDQYAPEWGGGYKLPTLIWDE